MTKAEHRLIVEMFINQVLLYAGLVEVLKTRNILDPGDLEAADALVSFSHRQTLDANTLDEYLNNAATLGVTTGLTREDDE